MAALVRDVGLPAVRGHVPVGEPTKFEMVINMEGSQGLVQARDAETDAAWRRPRWEISGFGLAFPVPQNAFPVNSHWELLRSGCRAVVSWSEPHPKASK